MTEPHPDGRPYDPDHRCVPLPPAHGMLVPDVVGGRIEYVEVLDPAAAPGHQPRPGLNSPPPQGLQSTHGIPPAFTAGPCIGSPAAESAEVSPGAADGTAVGLGVRETARVSRTRPAGIPDEKTAFTP